MKVAVVGAGGFVGGRLVEQWHLERVADVVPIVRRPESAVGAARFGLAARVADALDERALAAALAGCDALVHAAAGDRSLVVRSAVSVPRAAERAGVRCVVYLSSMAVHGWHPPAGTDERSPLRARQPLPYNTWKVRAERVIARACAERGVRLAILRPGIVYGPRSRWVADFARRLLDGRASVVDGGRGVCNAVYVDNLAAAALALLDRPDLDGEAFLVSDEESVSWRGLYEPVCRALGRRWEEVQNLPSRPLRQSPRERFEAIRDAARTQALLAHAPLGLRRALARAVESRLGDASAPHVDLETALLQTCRYRFPIAKACRLLDYRPPVPFAEGCRRTIAWLEFAGFPVQT